MEAGTKKEGTLRGCKTGSDGWTQSMFPDRQTAISHHISETTVAQRQLGAEDLCLELENSLSVSVKPALRRAALRRLGVPGFFL